jgi:hypothetical protein
MIKTDWYSITDKQPELGDEIYVKSIFDNKITVGTWYEQMGDDGKLYSMVLHDNKTPTSMEYIEYWSKSLKELLK